MPAVEGALLLLGVARRHAVESRPSTAWEGSIYRKITRPPHPRGRVRQPAGQLTRNGVLRCRSASVWSAARAPLS